MKTWALCISMTLAGLSPAKAQNLALRLYDGETGQRFAGCLNCSRTDELAVCNRYGDFGSRYSDNSILNPYGPFGSRYETNSPWNRYGEGLRITDKSGGYYGRFTLNRYADQSRFPLIQNILAVYDRIEDLQTLREIFRD